MCAWLLLVITVPSLVARDVHGITASAVLKTLAVLALIALAWEWRSRKMGLRLTSDGIEAIRAVDTVRVRWGDVEGFFLRGFGMWGEQTVHVQRKRALRLMVPRGFGMRLPTIILNGPSSPARRWFGACDLVGGDSTIPQDKLVGFLNAELQRRA
jgi:hypothetical protein